MDILTHLRYFQTVCKHENITRASNALFVSQPTITSSIQALEKELGFKLFIRDKSRIFLTADGKRFLEMLNEQMTSFDNFYKRATELGKNKKCLTIGIPPILNSFFLERIFTKFKSQHMDIHLTIIETSTYVGLQKVNDYALDFFVGAINGDVSAYNVKAIFETLLVLWSGKNHPLAKEKIITKDMLENHPFIMMPEGSYHFKVVSKEYKDVPLNVVMHSNQLLTIRNLLKNNEALTILYKHAFEADEELCERPLSKPLPTTIGLFWKKDGYVSNTMESFLLFIERIADQLL